MEVTRGYEMGRHCEDPDTLLLETGLGTKPPEGPVGPRIPEGLVPCRDVVSLRKGNLASSLSNSPMLGGAAISSPPTDPERSSPGRGLRRSYCLCLLSRSSSPRVHRGQAPSGVILLS